MKKQRILISGWYGFGNVGDEAILQALIDEFQKDYDNPIVTALSYRPAYTRRVQGVDAAHQVPFTTISWLSWIIKFRWLKTIWFFLQCDIFVMGGGGFLSDWDPAVPKGWLKQFRLARLLGKRTLLYGIGAGPFKTPAARNTVAHYLNNYVEKITVRDHASYDCLVSDCHVNADLVDIKVDPVAKMNVAPYFEKGVAQTHIGIIYTKYFDRPIFGEAQSQWPILFDCFVEQIRTVQEKNIPVKLIFFQPEIEQDLADALKTACNVEAVYPSDYKEALREMSSCKGIISFRLHGNILAYAMGVPFLPIVYHHKGLGFLEMVGFSEKYSPIVVGDGINLPKQPLDKAEWRRATDEFLLHLERHG